MDSEEYVRQLLAKDERDAVSDINEVLGDAAIERASKIADYYNDIIDRERTRAETAERERDEALAQAEELDAANTALKRTAEAALAQLREARLDVEEARAMLTAETNAKHRALAREAALRDVVADVRARTFWLDGPNDGDGHWWVDVAGLPSVLDAILAQPNPAAGKRLVDAARLEALETFHNCTRLGELALIDAPFDMACPDGECPVCALDALRAGEEGAK